MTKKIFLFAALYVLTATANAQFHLGAKAGLNATKIDGQSFKDQFEYNYLVGAFAEIGFANRFSIIPEVLFTQASATLADGVDESIFNINQAKVKLSYLSIPILLNVKVGGPLHIEAGPQYSILINSEENLLQNGQNAFKNGDFSMVGGVQLRLSRLWLTGRYLVGLDNISDLPNNSKWQKQAIQATVGFAIF